MIQRKSKAIVALMGLLGATLLLTGTASAGHLSCGDTITTDTVLDADIGPCGLPGGLIFGADDITLDLNGHRIFGNGTGSGAGIDSNGFSLVKVVGPGTVDHFDAGVVIHGVGSFGAEVSGITAEDNQGTFLTDYGDGILVLDSGLAKVYDNVIRRNGPYDGIGLLGAVEGTEVYNNVVTNNNVYLPTSAQTDGIRVEASLITPKPVANKVYNNTVTGNGLDGITLFQGSVETVVENNVVSNNGHNHPFTHRKGDGIRAFTPATSTIRNNVVCGNYENGIVTGFTVGLPGSGTGNHKISSNDVGAGTSGCAANNAGSTLSGRDLNDTVMSNPQFASWPAGAPCAGNIWEGNYTVGDTFNHPCVTNNSTADVSVTKTADPAAALGDDVTYNLTATNQGPNKADSVTVTDALPAGMDFVSASAGCSNSGGTVTCSMGTLASGASASATITVSPSAAGTYNNTATVSAAQPDPSAGNNSSSATTMVNNSRGCTLVGSAGDDAMSGTAGDDVICSRSGNDTVSALDGNDTVWAGSGNDTSSGNQGTDTLVGQSGNDGLLGGNGSDNLNGVDGVSGNDSLDGGNGPDVCSSDPGDTQVSC